MRRRLAPGRLGTPVVEASGMEVARRNIRAKATQSHLRHGGASGRSRARPGGRRALPGVGAGGRAGRGRPRRPAGPPRRGVPRVPLRASSPAVDGRERVHVPPRRRARPTPIPRRASSPTGRTGRPRSSTRPPSPGPTRRWPGVPREGQVLYEMHVGHVHAEGTWDAAAASCRSWRELGITVLEVMPVADFPGRLRLGLRRRRPLRPDAALRPARRLPRASSTAPTPSAWA